MYSLGYHRDHSGGNSGLCDLVPGLQVVGGKRDSIPNRTRAVGDGDDLMMGSIKISCIETP